MISGIKAVLAVIIFSLLIPGGWLLASGNFPGVYYENEMSHIALNRAWPRLSAETFSKTRRICRHLRQKGIQLPPTYNERMVKIARIRAQVKCVCDLILRDSWVI